MPQLEQKGPPAMGHKSFETGDEQIQIYMHSDGSLTIEAQADYGDSETGWGETYKTLHLTPKQVEEFRKFLTV